MKDLVEANLCLGLEIWRDRESRTLFLSQQDYVQGVLERFEMEDSKKVLTPMENVRKLEKGWNGRMMMLTALLEIFFVGN